MLLGILIAAPLAAEERILLDPAPRWVISGTWSAEGQTLWLVDAFKSTVLGYDLDGKQQAFHIIPQGTLTFSRPSMIQPWQNGFLVEQEGTGFVYLDKAFQLEEEFVTLMPDRVIDTDSPGTPKQLEVPLRPNLNQLVGVHGWTSLSKKGPIFGLIDLRVDDELWTGFARFTLDAPAEAQQFLATDAGYKDFYLLGMELIASLGKKGYALVMGTKPTILEVDEHNRTRELDLIPEGLKGLPVLPEIDLEQLPQIYAQLAQAHMVAGLYAWNDRLYLLSRDFQWAKNDCRWTLTRIDPERQRIEATIHIPTKAPHLTVIPGDDYWAFVEKGPVKGFGQQDIPSMLLMPADDFRRTTPKPADGRDATELTAKP